MQTFNLIDNNDNYSKISGSLQQYYRDELILDDNGAIVNFPTDNISSALFKFKTKIADRKEMMTEKMLKLWYH